MPTMPLGPCHVPTCPNRADCREHRLTTSQRGYGTSHQRERATARPGARCARCGSTRNLQRNHIVPRSLGGSDSPGNKEWLCEECHPRFGVKRNSRSVRPQRACA